MTGQAQALVAGGGPAGASVATLLARAGKRVVLVERSTGPHDTVCGEFLSAEAILYLQTLGADPFALGAVPIRKLRLIAGARRVEIELPFSAASLSRRVLDEALLSCAAGSGAEIRRGIAVRELAAHCGAWRARLDSGETVAADAAFLATGKHDIKGWKRSEGLHSDLIGLKMHWRLAPEQQAGLGHAVELVLFPGGYVGIQPVEDGRVNLCLLVRRRRYADLDRDWGKLVDMLRGSSPLVEARLNQASPCRDRPLAVGAIPFGHVRRAGAGPWCVGDQAAVVPSFTGNGISVALHSANLAADAFLAGNSAAHYHRLLSRDVARLARRGALLSLMLVRPTAQTALVRALQRFPRLVEISASLTRLPDSALRRTCMAASPRLQT